MQAQRGGRGAAPPTHNLAAKGKTRYPLHRRLGVSPGRSGRHGKPRPSGIRSAGHKENEKIEL